MYALNFYSPIVADQLRSRRKTATIRLGDKSAKYRKGMVVQILVGQRYGPREKIFDAVIDKVEVKRLMECSSLASVAPESPAPALALRIRPPKASAGRRAVPQSSHSTAKADANRAEHEGHRQRISPAQPGQAGGSSASNSSK